ncbi:unnamed protein product [Phytomonas sp. EM1]|nr:unnamed protein product [Phytomonas sp. EM1]|eukprot:CCW65357.1 unnamed protein product [Phytomonas sp. isolate EM1]
MGGLNNVAVRVPNTPMMVAAAPGSLGQDVLPLSLATLTAKPLYGVPMPMAMPVPVPYTFVSVPQGMPAQRYYITS